MSDVCSRCGHPKPEGIDHIWACCGDGPGLEGVIKPESVECLRRQLADATDKLTKLRAELEMVGREHARVITERDDATEKLKAAELELAEVRRLCGRNLAARVRRDALAAMGYGEQPRQGGADGEYASESIWRELNGLYEIAKAAWALRTSTDQDAAGKLDEALDFFANVAIKSRMDRTIKPVPFPTLSRQQQASAWVPVEERPLVPGEKRLMAVSILRNGKPAWDVFIGALSEEYDDEFSDDNGCTDPGWSPDDVTLTADLPALPPLPAERTAKEPSDG